MPTLPGPTSRATPQDPARGALDAVLSSVSAEVLREEERIAQAAARARETLAQPGAAEALCVSAPQRRAQAASAVRMLRRRLRRLREDLDGAWLTLDETFAELAQLRVEKLGLAQEVEQLRQEQARLRVELAETRAVLAGERDALRRAHDETDAANHALHRDITERHSLEQDLERVRAENRDLAYLLAWLRHHRDG
ncbi:MAG: hypothetical protein AB2A00_07235 [Myxococcota bacterium]